MRRLVAALAAKADGMRKHLQFLAHRAGSPILAQSQVERLAEVQQLATPARRAELERQIADLDKRRQAVDAVREETLHVLHRELVQLPPKVLLGVLDAVGARVPTLVGSAGVERPRAMLADAIIEAAREDSSAFLAAVRQLVDQGETPRGGPIGDALERLAASFANSTETIRKMDSLYAQVESQVGLTPQELMERLGNNEDLRAVLTNEARKTALAAGRPELADQFASHVEIAEYDGIKREIAEKLSRLSREEQERCLAEGDLSGLVADSLPGVPGAPTSTLANEPRLTLTEWGAFIARALAAAGDNHDLVRVVDDYLRKRSVEAFGIAHRASACQEIEDSTRWVTALSAIWAQCGFPLVQPTHKLAASLILRCTMPWPTINIAVSDVLEKMKLMVHKRS